MRFLFILFILFSSCSSSAPSFKAKPYLGKIEVQNVSCQRKKISYLALTSDQVPDLKRCEFIRKLKKYPVSKNQCSEFFTFLSQSGENKIVLAPSESAFVMELQKREEVEIFECSPPYFQAFKNLEKQIRRQTK